MHLVLHCCLGLHLCLAAGHVSIVLPGSVMPSCITHTDVGRRSCQKPTARSVFLELAFIECSKSACDFINFLQRLIPMIFTSTWSERDRKKILRIRQGHFKLIIRLAVHRRWYWEIKQGFCAESVTKLSPCHHIILVKSSSSTPAYWGYLVNLLFFFY